MRNTLCFHRHLNKWRLYKDCEHIRQWYDGFLRQHDNSEIAKKIIKAFTDSGLLKLVAFDYGRVHKKEVLEFYLNSGMGMIISLPKWMGRKWLSMLRIYELHLTCHLHHILIFQLTLSTRRHFGKKSAVKVPQLM